MILTFARYEDKDGSRIEFNHKSDGSLYVEISYNDVEIPFCFVITEEDKKELLTFLTSNKL